MSSTALPTPILSRGATLSQPDPGMAELLALKPRALWNALKRQRLSFWLLSIYMLFEYVRPQAIYTWMEPIPWTQIFLILAPIAFFVESGQLRARNPMNVWIIAFTVAVLLSSVLAIFPAESYAELYVYLTWVAVFFLIANVFDTQEKFFLFFLLYLLASLKMSQHGFRTWLARGFGFADWGATGAPGWFQNSGEFGIQMCIFTPLTIYLLVALKKYTTKRQQWLLLILPVTALASIIASNSRGAVFGALASGLYVLMRTRYRVRVLIALATVIAVGYYVMPPESRERFTTMGDDKTSVSRKVFWRHGIELFKEYPLTGIGYENWKEVYPQRYGRKALPHNIFIQGGAELGVLGLVTLLGLIGATFLTNRRTRKLATPLGDRGRFFVLISRGLDAGMVGFLVAGFFVTVLFYPFLWFNAAMTAALAHAASHEASRTGPVPVPIRSVVRPSEGWRTGLTPRAVPVGPVSTRHPVQPRRGAPPSRGNRFAP